MEQEIPQTLNGNVITQNEILRFAQKPDGFYSQYTVKDWILLGRARCGTPWNDAQQKSLLRNGAFKSNCVCAENLHNSPTC